MWRRNPRRGGEGEGREKGEGWGRQQGGGGRGGREDEDGGGGGFGCSNLLKGAERTEGYGLKPPLTMSRAWD